MEWLNLRLADARSPQFIGSEPVERSTWLSVLVYCVDQENGGVVFGGASWKDRQWQQACGVTAREVRRATKLLRIVGDDVHVMFYPIEKELIVKRKREIGRSGGLASGEARSEPKAEPYGSSKREPNARTEGERKGKEKGNIPPTPKRQLPTTPEAQRLAALFRRRLTTPWSEKEIRAFKAIGPISSDDLDAIERYYAAERAKGDDAGRHRRDLLTFLNNFPGELDRAHAKPARPSPSKTATTDAAIRAEVRAQLAAFDAWMMQTRSWTKDPDAVPLDVLRDFLASRKEAA